MFRYLVILSLLALVPVNAIVNFCAQNTFTTNSSWLQLNKEASSFEYALEKGFKGLHCCAKGYRSIEWQKDGKKYPWPSDVSNLIIYPESANQTIYTQTVSGTDTGNYTCVLSNDTHVRSHTIHLQVFDKIPDAPKFTYTPQSQEVELGEQVRLFCEAFVGRVILPDAENDASWGRPDENGTSIIQDQSGIHQEKVIREDGSTIGVYLVIDKLTKEDYGEYTCRITKPDKYIDRQVNITEKVLVEQVIPNPVPWKKIGVIFAISVLVVLTAVVLNMQYGLAVRVWFKDYFGPLEDDDGKTNDVLICYSQKDAEIVLGVLLPKLESKYHYKCGSREFSSNVNYWHVELAEAARSARRLLAVLSPGAMADRWEPTPLLTALKQLQALGPAQHNPIICVTLKPLPCSTPQVKNIQGETLRSVIKSGSVRVNQWRSADERFWLELRLSLPAQRALRRRNVSGPPLPQATPTRLTSHSRESLEILV